MEDAMRNVRPQMKVVDSTGAEVGTVDELKMGDPEAITAEGQTANENRGLVSNLADTIVGSEPDVPPQLADRLLRTGYIKIDSKGLFAKDVYAAGDSIERVEGDTVYLSLNKDELAAEM